MGLRSCRKSQDEEEGGSEVLSRSKLVWTGGQSQPRVRSQDSGSGEENTKMTKQELPTPGHF